MILDAIISAFAAVVAFLIGLLPSWTPPAWVATVTGTLADAVGHIGMLSGWLPIAAIGHSVAFILACSGVALAFRFGRIVLSLFTGGGGSAA